MICTKCNLDKGTDFRKNRYVCRECDNEIAREYRKKLKNIEKPNSIICNVCKLKKTEFRINRGKCLDCEKEHGRKYRQETDKAKIWATENKEQMSKLLHNWYDKNRKEITAKMSERYKTDEIYRKTIDHRNMLRKMIKVNKNTKSKHVNCDSSRLHSWLEFQFSDDMSFDNYGTYWVVDHVIPIHKYLRGEYSEEIVLNWLNICPVLKHKNLIKNKYIDMDQCLEHIENIRAYNIEICKIEDTEYISVLRKICL